MDEPQRGCCSSRILFILPVELTHDGRPELPISLRATNSILIITLLGLVTIFFLLGWVGGSVNTQRTIDAAEDAAVDGMKPNAYQKYLINIADEQRRATVALTNGANPTEICLACDAVEDDLIVLFSYDNYATPMPCTCTGTVCLKTKMIVETHGMEESSGESNSEDVHNNNGWA